MESGKVVMLQSVQLNLGPPSDFITEMIASRDLVASHPPEGFLYSRGGFVLDRTPPTFEVLTGWDNDKF